MGIQDFFNKHKKVLGKISGAITIALIILPFIIGDVRATREMGYLGYLVGTFLGYNLILTPFFISTLNPLIMV